MSVDLINKLFKDYFYKEEPRYYDEPTEEVYDVYNHNQKIKKVHDKINGIIAKSGEIIGRNL